MENRQILERLSALRNAMKENGINCYMIASADCHGSEYVHEHFRARAYFSGFTGSSGTLIVEEKSAALWTDGRYFVQAEEELSGTGIELMRMDEKDVPTIEKYLQEKLQKGDVIGFDGSCINARQGEKLEKICLEKGAAISFEKDLAGMLWRERPDLPAERVWELAEEYAGLSCAEKLLKVRQEMEKEGADYLFLSSLDDIMWLFNLRGGDIKHNPVALSYAFVGRDECTLFLQKKAAQGLSLSRFGVEIEEYVSVFAWLNRKLKTIGKKEVKVSASGDHLSYRLQKIFSAQCELILQESPTVLLKAVKNERELAHSRDAYVRDSAALCKFICWLKGHIGTEEITELSAAGKLEEYRREVPGFLDLSFTTICGYAADGALPHYSATPESDRQFENRSMAVIDSGGQYMGGTTDVTRTIALGEVGGEEKRAFSLVAAAMLRLADASFLEGATGRNLDILARQELWKAHLDYKHGTGHGIGYILNVHEDPQRIAWQNWKGKKEYALQAGMLISDEPGLYFAGKFGVRTENILEVVKEEENEYGTFLGFRHLTWVPIDRDALDKRFLTAEDVARINAYHRAVREKIAPYLEGAEREWLTRATEEL